MGQVTVGHRKGCYCATCKTKRSANNGRTKVVAVETRTIDGREFVVQRLDNPAAERASTKTNWSGYRPHNKKRDVTRGAGSRKLKMRKGA